MRRSVLALLLIFAAVAPAAAAGYDDFLKGMAQSRSGDGRLAIESFSAAIAAGDLSPGLLPTAYFNRALIYVRMGRCDAALADLDVAIKLTPDNMDEMVLRAGAHACKRDFAAAVADYSQIIAKSPVPEMYGGRGRMRWRMGDFAGAADDFAQQSRLAPKDAYAVLWLEVTRARLGPLNGDGVDADADRVDRREWPAPLLALYAGRSNPQEVDAAAARPGRMAAAAQLCESAFYVGEWLLAGKDVAGAKAYLQRAVASCPHAYVEYNTAVAELERLG